MYSNEELQSAIEQGLALVLVVTCKGDHQALFIQPQKESK